MTNGGERRSFFGEIVHDLAVVALVVGGAALLGTGIKNLEHM